MRNRFRLIGSARRQRLRGGRVKVNRPRSLHRGDRGDARLGQPALLRRFATVILCTPAATVGVAGRKHGARRLRHGDGYRHIQTPYRLCHTSHGRRRSPDVGGGVRAETGAVKYRDAIGREQGCILCTRTQRISRILAVALEANGASLGGRSYSLDW